ncbi:MAG: hypothetical protein MUF36_11565 [Bacteroidales bacterium]|jgi:hypothetical protein|nr:hypothetical protein [Bacteroidales bacterium]
MKLYDQGRCGFLKKSASATAAFTLIPRHAFGRHGYTAPSNQLTKGIIGVGEDQEEVCPQ